MGAGESAQEIRAQSGPYRTRRVPDLPKNKLPHEVLDGFTNYMKTEIEKSQEKQKRNRQVTQKNTVKPSNHPVNQIPELKTTPEVKFPKDKAAVNEDKNTEKPENNKHDSEGKPDLTVDTQVKKEKNGETVKEEEKRDGNVVEFKVDTEEKEIDGYRHPESPRPAPPLFDDYYEVEAVYNKEERKAKEKEALELAQKIAHEQKLKVEQELGEKKNELNQLENKYENIAAKYMNK